MSGWKHDGLLADLAGYLRSPQRLVWTDMQLGPAGSPRPDVFTLDRCYSRPRPTAFEVKISRSDLRADTTAGKWQSYLKFAGSVTFAVPDGLCTVGDIPDGCGLIVRKAEVWRYARRPTVQAVTPPFSACMKLLLDGVDRVSRPPAATPRTVATWLEHAAVRKRFGAAVDQAARDLVAVEKRIADLKGVEAHEHDQMRRRIEIRQAAMIERAKADAAQYEAARRDLLAWLELADSDSIHLIQGRIAALRAACDADTRVRAADRQLAAARHSIELALRSISPQVPA